MHDTGQQRFFVTVSARSASDLRRLQVHGMDLFNATARKKKGKPPHPFAIEGLLEQAEIAKLSADGYDVKVEAPMAERTVQPGDTLEFEPWLAQVGESMAKDRGVK